MFFPLLTSLLMRTHMSGECTVFTCPAYSSWSSIGINTLSPSTRESLSSTHCTGAEHNTTPNSNKYTCYHLTIWGSSLRALTGSRGTLWHTAASCWEEFVLAEAAVLVVFEVFVCRHALHQPAHRTPGRLQHKQADLIRFPKNRDDVIFLTIKLLWNKSDSPCDTVAFLLNVDLWHSTKSPGWHTTNELFTHKQ